MHHARAVGLLIELHLFDDAADQVLRVGRVVDREIRPVTDRFGLAAQDTVEDGMKRAHAQPTPQRLVRQRSDTVFHLAGSLVCKRKRQNAVRGQSLFKQMNDFVRQDARLARARARYYHGWTVAVQNDFALIII